MDGFPWGAFFDGLELTGASLANAKAFRVLDVNFFQSLCGWFRTVPPPPHLPARTHARARARARTAAAHPRS